MKLSKKKTMVAMIRSRTFFVLAFFLLALPSSDLRAQPDSVNQKRLTTVIVSSAVILPSTYFGLYHLWYKNSPHQSFTFFNDNHEWKQVDKAGHFISSFYFAYGSSQVLRWTNYRPTKADVAGAVAGFLITAPIEIFDGHSEAYGASSGDLIADAAGPLFFVGQKRLWNEIRIQPKFSFHRTKYAELRPNLLGDNLPSEILKDYNGQTYWLTVDMDKFTYFPKWLNVAVGYGADGMVYARDRENAFHGYSAYRQYYLSVDFDLTAIRTRSKFVKTLVFLASAIKLPAPALQFSKKGVDFRGFYF
ncbi:MAG TPA: DUF2279 domain-containing protein [Sphingobacteriaceae bacterium]